MSAAAAASSGCSGQRNDFINQGFLLSICGTVVDDEMMIAVQRDDDKNVIPADSAELAEKNGRKQNPDPIPEVILDFDSAFCNLLLPYSLIRDNSSSFRPTTPGTFLSV